MKKKLLIVSMFIIFVIILSLVSYAHFSKNVSKDSDTKNVVKKEKEVHNSDENSENKSNIVDLSEDNESYEQVLEKEEEKKDSYPHNSSKETITSSKQETQSNTTQSTNSQTNSSSNSSSGENNSSNQNITNQTPTNEPVNQDEKMWEEFKKDPFVLMILESDSIDWESKSEQEIEANKWINLGYRVEMPYQCINISGTNRCVYGLIVYLPKGICGETPNEIKVDWRKRNYVGIVTYAKSIGYKCEGYQD